ncbi:uncharacterized protein B0H18DRAFT_1122839 [Fomitopsis serialis]|uniref:uncharacterized protein n=1 Tax=Fomitopsis serialis TaxID=139415 RepID=UPI0020076CB5|nr:uncharacterized protein B0H18DRAFT_1122839 [Neoantrodia serialis]KAH9918871.1 hypothetical protein B0H18DRAFT_1122839 [Neoantrodia serialis]
MEDRDEHVARRAYHTHGVAWAYQSWPFAFFVVEARSVEMALDIEGKPFAGNESNVFDLDSDWPAYFCIGGGTTAATDSCSMAWGVPWVLCEARRMLATRGSWTWSTTAQACRGSWADLGTLCWRRQAWGWASVTTLTDAWRSSGWWWTWHRMASIDGTGVGAGEGSTYLHRVQPGPFVALEVPPQLRLELLQRCQFDVELLLERIWDDTYSNKSWRIVGQGMFGLREINQRVREMCSYPERQLDIELAALREFEVKVRRDFKGHEPYATVPQLAQCPDNFNILKQSYAASPPRCRAAPRDTHAIDQDPVAVVVPLPLRTQASKTLSRSNTLESIPAKEFPSISTTPSTDRSSAANNLKAEGQDFPRSTKISLVLPKGERNIVTMLAAHRCI